MVRSDWAGWPEALGPNRRSCVDCGCRRSESSMVGAAIHASGLIKRFGDKTAVDGLNLKVPVGSWYGVVGPNGAGKTTSIRMMVPSSVDPFCP